jgi:hypothetical protein
MDSDAVRIARFIVEWFPGYEDGIEWGDLTGPEGNNREHNEIYRAAQRILALEAQQEKR